MFTHAPQPAFERYSWINALSLIRATYIKTWHLNQEKSYTWWEKAKQIRRERDNDGLEFSRVAAWFYIIMALTLPLIGILTTTLLALAHLLLYILYLYLIYLNILLFLSLDTLWRYLRHLSTRCPACHHHTQLPHYRCPTCQRIHTQLIPSTYGIFYRQCHCTTLLPTLFFNGRKNLPALCAHCHEPIHIAEIKPLCIPLIGGTNAGKTTYLWSLHYDLITTTAPTKKWQIYFTTPENQAHYQNQIHTLQQKKTLPPTPPAQQTATTLLLTLPEKHTPRLLYFYDTAGSHFKHSQHLHKQAFYQHFHGLIILIDPFTLPALQRQYPLPKDHRYSSDLIEDTLDTFLLHTTTLKKPCAIIINKMDLFDLETRFGITAAKRLMTTRPDLTLATAQNFICRELLSACGLQHFLTTLDHHFTEHRFFTCSALANHTDKCQPANVSEPLLWLLSRMDDH